MNKELSLFQEEIDRNICVNPSRNIKFDRFSFKFNLVLLDPRSTNLLFGLLAIEPNTSLGSVQIESLHTQYMTILCDFFFLNSVPSSLYYLFIYS